jgi:hypothetical protein
MPPTNKFRVKTLAENNLSVSAPACLRRKYLDLPRIFKKEMAIIARLRIEKGLFAFNRQGAHDAASGKEIRN